MDSRTADRLSDIVYDLCKNLHKQGRSEYANSDNVFGNFIRLSNTLNISKEAVLVVYLIKHIDGIVSWINGQKSQREDVRGRIKDAIVYLTLLHLMIDETDVD